MSSQRFTELLREVAGRDVFAAPTEIDQTRREHEETVIAAMCEKQPGAVAFGDALQQFYGDTLKAVTRELPRVQNPTEADEMMVYWHVALSRRYAVSCDLLIRGHYSEAVILARGLWENSLTFAAIARGLVTVHDVLGGPATDPPPSMRDLRRKVAELDRNVQEQLLWKNPELEGPLLKATSRFIWLLNGATHKAQMALAISKERSARGDRIIFQPYYDDKEATLSWNLLFTATWSLMATLGPSLPYLSGPDHAQWAHRYAQALEAFDIWCNSSSSATVRSTGEVIRRVFVKH